MSSSARILLVDDDPYIREYVRSLLDKVGVRFILEANDAEEAKDILKTSGKVDLIFLDINMAPGNGLELLKNIRTGQTPVARSQPVIMMSANGEENLLGTAMALDCNAYLKKPISSKDIADKMLRVLGQTQQIRPSLAYNIIPVPDLDKKKNRPSSAPIKVTKAKKQTRSGNQQVKQSLFSKLWKSSGPSEEIYPVQASPKPVGKKNDRMKQTLSLKPEALMVGDVLAEDVHTQAGILLLEHGTELNETYIFRLLNLKSSCGSLMVKVKRVL